MLNLFPHATHTKEISNQNTESSVSILTPMTLIDVHTWKKLIKVVVLSMVKIKSCSSFTTQNQTPKTGSSIIRKQKCL